jgi:hypothetical protein
MQHRPIPILTAAQIQRFWKKADRAEADGCWLWRATTKDGRRGYRRPVVSIGPAGNRFFFGASRLAFYIATGVDPGEKEVCHTCDNPLCVNPQHLWLGTQPDNVADMVARKRHRPPMTGPGEDAPNHKLSESDVRRIRTLHGRQRDIARQYGVSQGTIHFLKTRKTWAHVL